MSINQVQENDGPALRLRNISRRFGSVAALDDVSFSARPGSIHALLGENGAGKTTLMRIAFGLIQPDAGEISISGRTVRFSSPADAIAAGIGMVHQQFSLIPAMTVAENVALGGRGRFDGESVARAIQEIGNRTGLVLNPAARVADLGSAERQKLEIVRTLVHDARILILDEPTAALSPKDVLELFAQLRQFASRGGTVVLITHKLSDALAHADEVTVLRRGRTVLSDAMTNATVESLTAAMIGSAGERPATSSAPNERAAAPTATIASLSDIPSRGSGGDLSQRITLDVQPGEILGIAALEGAAAPLLRMLAGRLVPSSGTVVIPDHVGFVPENRHEDAIVPDFTLTENFALRDLGSRKGRLDWDEIHAQTSSVISEFEVRADSAETLARHLSGGNQQRFVLGRELAGNPSLLILENPTQGLDVKATAAVHFRMREAADRGVAVVFYSSDLDELAEVPDRVIVVSPSGLVSSAPDRDTIGRLLLGATAMNASGLTE